MSFKPFHPPHVYLDDTIYFIASRTRDKFKYFNSNTKKSLLKKVLDSTIKIYGIHLFAWVILDDHYHLLIRVNKKEQLYKFIKSFHGKSAIELNKLESRKGRKIWTNYWDHGIRDEADFWKHFNYIHHNPVKHGYVKEMSDYKFSSYNYWLKKKGQDWIDSCFELYPIVDFTPQDV